MKNSVIITIITPLILTACFNSENIEDSTVLNCEQGAIASSNQLTMETATLFNGKESAEQKNSVREFCISKDIKSHKDCSSIEDSNYILACEAGAGIKTNTLEECDNSEYCKMGFAVSHIEDCDKYKGLHTPTFPLYNACLFARAYIHMDTKHCDQIDKISSSSEECTEIFMNWDENEEEAGECYLNRDKCYWVVSDWANDLEICEKMAGSFETEICILSNAIKNSDSSICDKLEINFFEDNCDELIKQRETHPLVEEGILNNFFNTSLLYR